LETLLGITSLRKSLKLQSIIKYQVHIHAGTAPHLNTVQQHLSKIKEGKYQQAKQINQNIPNSAKFLTNTLTSSLSPENENFKT
jgi:hypothetical protein